MKFTKGKLYNIINENLKEMAMSFDSPDRPDAGLQNTLRTGDTPHKKIPYPQSNNQNQNYQEKLASNRYKQIVEKFKQYTNFNGTLGNNQNLLMQLQMMMMQAFQDTVRLEAAHREELEKLAVDLVRAELDISEDEVTFDAKLVSVGEVDGSDFNREQNNQAPEMDNEADPESDVEDQVFGDLAQFNLERAKRRLINAMIQGGSMKGHYMYHLVSDKLREITGSDEIINTYSIMMSINDLNYWQFPDELLQAAMGGQNGEGGLLAGKEKIDMSTDPPTVHVTAVNFPTLVHELIKGSYELISALRGQPDDTEMAEKVISAEDTLEKEVWDVRLGPAIWDILREQMPEEAFNGDNAKRIQLLLYSHIIEKPAKEFLVFMKEVLSKSEQGRRLMQLLVDSIKAEIGDYDATEALREFDNTIEELSDNTDEDELGDFLGDLGISLPDDDE